MFAFSIGPLDMLLVAVILAPWVYVVRLGMEIGKKKGRGSDGLLLCLLFGPIGLALTCILPARD